MSEPRPGDNLLSKSKLFGELAKQHHDKEKYAAVPHLAYYCCYQLLLIIQHRKSVASNVLSESSHKRTILQVLDALESCCITAEERDLLMDNLLKLKDVRKLADYSDSVISEQLCAQTIETADNALEILRHHV